MPDDDVFASAVERGAIQKDGGKLRMVRDGDTRTVHDPFLNKDVEVSSRLTDRLRGRYASGPTMANGEPEFGWREFPTPPVQHEAAAEIDRLEEQNARLKDLLVKAAPAVERAWGLERGGPRKSRALSVLNAIRKAVPVSI